jgi:DTW domain-containing protein YfiP
VTKWEPKRLTLKTKPTEKFKRKRKTKDPCEICFLHRERCICSLIPKLILKTKVSLVVHAKELKRTTNTGRLALEALVNSQMFIRGLELETLNLSSILTEQYETYLLYPSDDARDISNLTFQKNVQLIVPDGNWRQAGKVHLRHPELKDVPRVKISKKNMASQHLRKEHRDEGMSTLEAIALALGAIEGDEVEMRLMELYRAKLSATLESRGQRI